MSAQAPSESSPPWIEVREYRHPAGWIGLPEPVAREYCRQIEQGGILYFSDVPDLLQQADMDFLRGQRRGDSRLHKNVSYRPEADVLRGAEGDAEVRTRTHEALRGYSQRVTRFAASVLAPYAGQWKLDYASFRPLEEEGRDLPLHKRNDLMHVDAFPSRPTHGARILRVFTNISTKPRVWLAGERFPQLAPRYAEAAGLGAIAGSGGALDTARRAYDRFMLHFHDWLKENADFQQNAPRQQVSFPPLSTWMVMTDTVPHAVLSGQYALEQTFIVPVEALVDPESAPLRVLEKIAGQKLA